MIKKLISLAVASASTLALAGCGESGDITVDKELMGDGTTNKTGLGGYWWTYVDRGATSQVNPNTGKVDPQNPTATELNPGLGAGKGLDSDSGNQAFHVTGYVGPALVYPPLEADYDAYWDTPFGSLCGGGKCKEYKYAAAGLGFGFKAHNLPLGADGAGTKGVTFRLKYGSTHGKNATGSWYPMSVSAPMAQTDSPDPSFGDEFGNVDASGKRIPICTFPGTLVNGTEIGSNSKTCFCNLTTGAATNVTDQWQTFCAAWTDFKSPGWGGLAGAGITGVDPTQVIKLQFDAYKPVSGEAKADFEIWVDDVRLVKEADWATRCATAVPLIKP